MLPPSVDHDAPEMLIGLELRHRESFRTTYLAFSGFARLYVSDWTTFGETSGPVIRLTSVPP